MSEAAKKAWCACTWFFHDLYVLELLGCDQDRGEALGQLCRFSVLWEHAGGDLSQDSTCSSSNEIKLHLFFCTPHFAIIYTLHLVLHLKDP